MDKTISFNIIKSDWFKKATQVLIFSSVGNEFDTRLLIDECRSLNKATFFPLCVDSFGKMEFLKVASSDDLQSGMYNIPEPKGTCEKYIQKENDLIIVPCLSVDREKNRIGYGKGYYDRFLKGFNGVSLCPCYCEMVTNKLPIDENDIKINIIVTDKEVIQ